MPQQTVMSDFHGHWLEEYNSANAWFESLDQLIRGEYGPDIRITVNFEGTIDGRILNIENDDIEVFVEGQLDTYTEPFTATFRLEVGGLTFPFLNIRVSGRPAQPDDGPPSDLPNDQ